ncbi:hypothetical protein GJ496_008278 [Pomphorhynchus laevis]|nr:hypothetical protein GJ496_008278 [Pomphorhynchus laevis]
MLNKIDYSALKDAFYVKSMQNFYIELRVELYVANVSSNITESNCWKYCSIAKFKRYCSPSTLNKIILKVLSELIGQSSTEQNVQLKRLTGGVKRFGQKPLFSEAVKDKTLCKSLELKLVCETREILLFEQCEEIQFTELRPSRTYLHPLQTAVEPRIIHSEINRYNLDSKLFRTVFQKLKRLVKSFGCFPCYVHLGTCPEHTTSLNLIN